MATPTSWSQSRTAGASRLPFRGRGSWRSKAWATTCLGGSGHRSRTRSPPWLTRRRLLNGLNPAIAFLAGLASFVSPCVLPLVPAYLAYLGARVGQPVAVAGAGFVAGLLLVFILFFFVFSLAGPPLPPYVPVGAGGLGVVIALPLGGGGCAPVSS